LVNGETYIGSAVDLTERLRDYLNPRWLNKEVLKHSSIIYRALLKYGYNNFRLEILEYCDKSLTTEREQYYIDKYQPTYNICKIAGSSLGRLTKSTTRSKLRNA
jgi:group I intron endonuclease